jgi:DnaK suppressor protein
MKGESNKMAFENGVNSQQMEYFRRRLLVWRDQLVSGSRQTACHSDEGSSLDLTGQAESAVNKDASSQSPDDRKQKLICKIDETLHCIKAGTYGV